jgi:hypothetical protein
MWQSEEALFRDAVALPGRAGNNTALGLLCVAKCTGQAGVSHRRRVGLLVSSKQVKYFV